MDRIRVALHMVVPVVNLVFAIQALIMMVSYPPPQIIPETPFHQFITHCHTYQHYFLSVWVGILQNLYFSIYPIIDFLEMKCARNARILKATDFMHTVASYLLFTIVFPLSLVVFILFWSLYTYNRELFYPQRLDDFIPTGLNHALHTLPVPLSALYMLVSNKKEPSKMASLVGLVSFLAIYCYLYLSIYIEEGKWVYVIFNLLTFAQAQCALICISLVSIGFHFLGYKLNDRIKCLKRQSFWIRLMSKRIHVQ